MARGQAAAAAPNSGAAIGGRARGAAGSASTPRCHAQSTLSARGAVALGCPGSGRGLAVHSARSTTARSEAEQAGDASLVAPPWGPERANRDQPDWEKNSQRQQCYHRQLDEQVALKAELSRLRKAELEELERKSAATLSTGTHVWGTEAYDAQGQREISQELKAQVEERRRQRQALREAERTEHTSKIDRSEKQLSRHQEEQRRQRQQTQGEFAASLRAAMEDKRQREEQERADTLQSERDHISRVVRGTQQPRRLLKPGAPPEYSPE